MEAAEKLSRELYPQAYRGRAFGRHAYSTTWRWLKDISIPGPEVTGHLEANIWLAEKMLDASFKVEKVGALYRVEKLAG